MPWDCRDGFLCVYWRRPGAYLDPAVRSCISGIARLEPTVVERGIGRLEVDLGNGSWQHRHADLLDLTEMDLGYRLVVSDPSTGS